jgi:creatinine amidohydrolase/Fe(II)-dependent formamide hydrolase-like protein
MGRTLYQQDISYIELLVHILRQVESLGFKVIVIIAGHYPLLSHAMSAVDFYSLEGKSKAWACTGFELVKDKIPDAGDHAAKWETSLLMALRPDCVDMDRLPKDMKVPLIGVGGIDPRGTASKKHGERGVQLVVERIVSKARELLKTFST